MASLEVRDRVRHRTRVALLDPATAKKRDDAVRAAMNRDDVREKISARTTAAMANPEVRRRIREGMARAEAKRLAQMRTLWGALSQNSRQQFVAEVMTGFLRK
jgi:hypothetical protein